MLTCIRLTPPADPEGAEPRRARYIIGQVGQCDGHLSDHLHKTHPACRSRRGGAQEGSSAFSPGVEARSADDPGFPAIRLIDTTPPGCRTPRACLIVRHPIGVEGSLPRRSIPGSSSGLAPLLDTRAKNRAPLPGCNPILQEQSPGGIGWRGTPTGGI